MKLNLHSIASPRCGTRRHSAQQRSRAPAQVASTTAIDEGHLRPVHRPNRDSSHRLLFRVLAQDLQVVQSPRSEVFQTCPPPCSNHLHEWSKGVP